MPPNQTAVRAFNTVCSTGGTLEISSLSDLGKSFDPDNDDDDASEDEDGGGQHARNKGRRGSWGRVRRSFFNKASSKSKGELATDRTEAEQPSPPPKPLPPSRPSPTPPLTGGYEEDGDLFSDDEDSEDWLAAYDSFSPRDDAPPGGRAEQPPWVPGKPATGVASAAAASTPTRRSAPASSSSSTGHHSAPSAPRRAASSIEPDRATGSAGVRVKAASAASPRGSGPPDIYILPRESTAPTWSLTPYVHPWTPPAEGPHMSTDPLTYGRLLQAAFSGDVLGALVNLVGLRRFHVFAMVCTAWHDAARQKMREWGVLEYVRTLGRGFGKLRGHFDMPTWLCMLPDGAWGSHLCVVDACNYRLQILQPHDGTVVRVVGRPGASFGQLSSPSSVACDPKANSKAGRRVFTSSTVGVDDRRLMAFDLETWVLSDSTPEGVGRTQLDAPEGMVVHKNGVYAVDTANHRVVAFDARTLEKVGQYPPVAWNGMRQGKRWDQLDNPMGIAAHDGELFVSDTHNDRIQVFNTALEWIGVIGQRGTEPGQFVYPRGVAVMSGHSSSASAHAPWLLYVAEQARIQGLTLLGEPRIIVPVPGASNLCGLCCDGARVYVSDMDSHTIHVLRLTHAERWQEKRREAIAEARRRRELCENAAAAAAASVARAATSTKGGRATQTRSDKELQRDRAVQAVLSGRTMHAMLGLEPAADTHAVRHAVRLAMRLLHPDHSINFALRGSAEYTRIEAAFKKVNNLKDERAEVWASAAQQERERRGDAAASEADHWSAGRPGGRRKGTV